MNFDKALKALKKNVSREPLYTFGAVTTVALTFLALNFFVFSVLSTHILLKYFEGRAQVSVFFLDSINEDQILKLKGDLEHDSRVAKVDYVSKKDALNIFRDREKNEPVMLSAVKSADSEGSNPLPASLGIKANNIEDLPKLSEELQKVEGVKSIKFYKPVVDTFSRWSNSLKIISLILLTVFSLLSVLMILITVGATIHSKGIEVEIMKLVGATDKYVKGPLVLQGIFYGVAASVLSTVIIYILLIAFLPTISSVFAGIPVKGAWWVNLVSLLLFATGKDHYLAIAAFLVGILVLELMFGVLLGYIGSSLAIKKYLKY